MRGQARPISIIGILLIAGCSSNGIFLDLSYPPESDVEYDRVESAPLVNGHLEPSEITLTIKDSRENKTRIGHIGGEYAYTDNNVEVWVFDAVAHELTHLGYDVVDVGISENNDIPNQLTVDLQELHFYTFGTATARVTLRATFQPENGESITVESPAELTSGLLLFNRDDKILENLARTLQMSIRHLLHECGFGASATLPRT